MALTRLGHWKSTLWIFSGGIAVWFASLAALATGV
jgi:hypothetical protein